MNKNKLEILNKECLKNVFYPEEQETAERKAGRRGDLAIARSIDQGLGLTFYRKDLTLG